MTDISFYLNAVFLGAALAIDAFSVSVVNGAAYKGGERGKAALSSSVFAAFQFIMPLLGWILVRSLLTAFTFLSGAVPYVALAILTALGAKSVSEGVKGSKESDAPALTLSALLLQGVATSLDALSVGLTISEDGFLSALLTSVIIGAVTYIICFAGAILGKSIGKTLKSKASILGGIVLIIIGVEIFLRGIIKI